MGGARRDDGELVACGVAEACEVDLYVLALNE